jgi:hypothetical protein
VSTATAVSTTTAAVEAATATTAVEAASATHARATVEATATTHARAAVEAATDVATVESTRCAYVTAVESTGVACECVAATGIASRTVVKAVSCSGVSNSTAITIVISTATVVSTATVIAPAAVVSAASPVTVIPGARADEEATDEPTRSIVALGCASVGIVVVVAPGADRSRISIPIIPVPPVVADTDTHTYLGVSRSRHQRCRNYQRSEQQKISEKLHFEPPRQGIMHCITSRFGDTSNTLGYLGCLPRKTTFLGKSCARVRSFGKPIAPSPHPYQTAPIPMTVSLLLHIRCRPTRTGSTTSRLLH